MLETAKGNDRFVEDQIQRVEGVGDGGMPDMLQNFVNVCQMGSMLPPTYLEHEYPVNPAIHQIAHFPDPPFSTSVPEPLCNEQ
jgi:hypothetical protein